MASGTALPVSVVIPAYRASAYLRTAIASLFHQAFVPAEVIVVDDASPDATADIAAAAGARVIRLETNSGPSFARNTGVAAATQPWIAFLDADDEWLEGKLAAQWVALCRWPDAGLCFTDYDAVYDDGRVVRREAAAHAGYAELARGERAVDAVRTEPDRFTRALLQSMFVRQSTTIVCRRLFLAVGGYDPELRMAEDYDLFLRLGGIAPVITIERSFVRYRRRGNSLSGDPLEEMAGIERLWTAILAHPERYPPLAPAYVREHSDEPLLKACRIALRRGRFTEAAALARRLQRRSPAARMLAATATALGTPPGTLSFRLARALWRARSLACGARLRGDDALAASSMNAQGQKYQPSAAGGTRPLDPDV